MDASFRDLTIIYPKLRFRLFFKVNVKNLITSRIKEQRRLKKKFVLLKIFSLLSFQIK